MTETIAWLADRPIDGIKLQLLHVLKGTDLAAMYQSDPFPVFSMEEYIDFVIDCVELLPPELTIHRLTGDGPKSLLIAPLWSADKKRVLNTFPAVLRSGEPGRDGANAACPHVTIRPAAVTDPAAMAPPDVFRLPVRFHPPPRQRTALSCSHKFGFPFFICKHPGIACRGSSRNQGKPGGFPVPLCCKQGCFWNTASEDEFPRLYTMGFPL